MSFTERHTPSIHESYISSNIEFQDNSSLCSDTDIIACNMLNMDCKIGLNSDVCVPRT